MAKFDRTSLLSTRLSPEDMVRFRALSEALDKSHTDMVRDAIREYLDRQETKSLEKQESIYAQQVRASTNRICALLAKTSLGVETMIEFMGQLENTENLMKQCRSVASKRVADQLTDEEALAGQAMYRKITGDVSRKPPTLNFESQNHYEVILKMKGWEWSELLIASVEWANWSKQTALDESKAGHDEKAKGWIRIIGSIQSVMDQVQIQINRQWRSKPEDGS